MGNVWGIIVIFKNYNLLKQDNIFTKVSFPKREKHWADCQARQILASPPSRIKRLQPNGGQSVVKRMGKSVGIT